jgi:hypothetical protein
VYGRSRTRPGSVTVVRICKGVSTKLSSVYLSMAIVTEPGLVGDLPYSRIQMTT